MSEETKDEYIKRMGEKATMRQKLNDDLVSAATKKRQEEAAERHWADRIYKPWPGAVGSGS